MTYRMAPKISLDHLQAYLPMSIVAPRFAAPELLPNGELLKEFVVYRLYLF